MTRDELERAARREIDRANWVHDLIAEAMTPSAEVIDMEEARSHHRATRHSRGGADWPRAEAMARTSRKPPPPDAADRVGWAGTPRRVGGGHSRQRPQHRPVIQTPGGCRQAAHSVRSIIGRVKVRDAPPTRGTARVRRDADGTTLRVVSQRRRATRQSRGGERTGPAQVDGASRKPPIPRHCGPRCSQQGHHLAASGAVIQTETTASPSDTGLDRREGATAGCGVSRRGDSFIVGACDAHTDG